MLSATVRSPTVFMLSSLGSLIMGFWMKYIFLLDRIVDLGHENYTLWPQPPPLFAWNHCIVILCQFIRMELGKAAFGCCYVIVIYRSLEPINTCQVYSGECVSNMHFILDIVCVAIYWSICYQHTLLCGLFKIAYLIFIRKSEVCLTLFIWKWSSAMWTHYYQKYDQKLTII